MDSALQKFVAVVEAGTFTKAADILHISQPALSVAMAKLEKSTGAKLFESSGRHGIVLTNAGELVYTAALEHRRVDHNLQVQLVSLSEQKVPLSIGMIDSVASLLSTWPQHLSTLEETTELNLVVADSASLRRGVLRSELDLAIIVADDVADNRLEIGAVAADMLICVCSPAVAGDMQARIDAHEPVPFLSYIRSSATYLVIAQALKRAAISVEPIMFSSSPDVMRDMALHGRGVAILPELLVADRVKRGALVALSFKGKPYKIERRLHVVTLVGRKIPPRLIGLAFAMRSKLKPYTIFLRKHDWTQD